MSLMSRATSPAAAGELAGLVRALLTDPRRPGSREILPPGEGTGAAPSAADGSAAAGPAAAAPAAAAPAAGPAVRRLPYGPTGLGTSAARAFVRRLTSEPGGDPGGDPGRDAGGDPGRGRERDLGRDPVPEVAAGDGDSGVPPLYCPPAVRDDPALGEEVNERLVAWAEEIGIYPGQLDKVRSADFGRLIMLAHPESDDPDRLLAAARCALSEWSVDDHYVDGEVGEAHPESLGQRLAIAHSVIDQAHLPLRYAPELEQVVRADPVMRALRDGLDNLARYATPGQVHRLRHELGIMFVAYNHEAFWLARGHTPPVWEFMMHRHENSFIPCMVLIDAVAGYELPYNEFADPRVRRAFTMAGTATVIVNDLYSMGKESPTDFSLPRLIAREEGCSLREAVDRTVLVHDELMHTFEAEAAALSVAGSPELRRFFAGVWAWAGGNREWHAGTARYRTTGDAAA